MRTILVFDNDGVLRDESKSYQKAISQTVFDFSDNYPSEEELIDSMKESNDDWQRTYNILNQRGINIKFDEVKEHFQDLYLGKKRDFTGYINDEPWLIENILLYKLSKRYEMVIVSGAPREEIEFTLKKNYARCFFNEIWGMHECNGKKDGLEKVIERKIEQMKSGTSIMQYLRKQSPQPSLLKIDMRKPKPSPYAKHWRKHHEISKKYSKEEKKLNKEIEKLKSKKSK